MTVSAFDVIAALRARLPDLPKVKLHKLLYYCQGHHLAAFGEPMFRERISAFDNGPVVAEVWKRLQSGDEPETRGELTEAELNTIGYVVSRYGSLTGTDLIRLTHAEDPWRIASRDRLPGQRTKIELEWMTEFFRSSPTDDEPDDLPLAAEVIEEWLRSAEDRSDGSTRVDSPDEIMARVKRA